MNQYIWNYKLTRRKCDTVPLKSLHKTDKKCILFYLFSEETPPPPRQTFVICMHRFALLYPTVCVYPGMEALLTPTGHAYFHTVRKYLTFK